MLDIKTENALDIHCDDIVNHSLSPGKNKECGSGYFFEGQIRIRFFLTVGSGFFLKSWIGVKRFFTPPPLNFSLETRGKGPFYIEKKFSVMTS